MEVNPVVAPKFVKFELVEQKLLTFGRYVAETQSSPCPKVLPRTAKNKRNTTIFNLKIISV
jgi:hypothetical protein